MTPIEMRISHRHNGVYMVKYRLVVVSGDLKWGGEMKRFGSLVVASLFVLQGCTSMASYEKIKYDQLKRDLDAYSLPVMEDKDPVLAGALNLVLGFGNAYLEQWGPFVANLLFWPLSSIWGVPQAYIDAKTLNKKETLYFYEFGPGKERLTAAKGQPAATPATP